MAPATLRFRVRKASKYLFDCAGVDPADAGELQRLALVSVRAEEMAALGIEDVDVRKRLGLGEVERLVACCQPPPPDVVVAPATQKHRSEFETFAKYLNDRKRAGVATLAGGLLLVLVPLAGTHRFLRCVVVKAATTAAGDGVVAVSASSLPKKRPPPAPAIQLDKSPAATQAAPSSVADTAIAAPARGKTNRKRPRLERTVSPGGSAERPIADVASVTAATTNSDQPSPTEPASKKASRTAQGAVDLKSACPGVATTNALRWRSRKALFTQLRHESNAFHLHHSTRLRKWRERAAPPP